MTKKAPAHLQEVADIIAKNISIKVITWVKNIGYQIIERKLGSSVTYPNSYAQSYELFVYQNHGDKYYLIQQSKALESYQGLSNDYKFDLKILRESGKSGEITISEYEAFKYIVQNKTSSWNRSPYSASYYSSKNITWGSKPEGSLRVSDHWNFGENREHCPTVEKVEGWAVCQYRNGIYHLLQTFG